MKLTCGPTGGGTKAREQKAKSLNQSAGGVLTSATRRAKLEYLSGVKTLGEAALRVCSRAGRQLLSWQQRGPRRPLAVSLASCSSLWVQAGTRGLRCTPGARVRAQRVAFWGPSWLARACPSMLRRASCFRDRQPIGNLSRCPWGGLWIHAAWRANTVSPRFQALDVLCHTTYTTKWPRHALFGASRGAS